MYIFLDKKIQMFLVKANQVSGVCDNENKRHLMKYIYIYKMCEHTDERITIYIFLH